MEFYDRINARRSRCPLNEELEQDLGSGFQFSEDADALQSILSNTGISQAQRQAMNHAALTSAPGATSRLTPAKHTQAADEKFEFFQGQGGHVFFRRKVGVPHHNGLPGGGSHEERRDGAGVATGLAPSDTLSKYKPRRFGSGKKANNFSSSSRKENYDPSSFAMSEKKKRVEMFVAPHRQSISEKKPVRRRSQLPQHQPPANTAGSKPGARKGLQFEKAKDVFKKPFTPLTLTDKHLAAKPGENKLPLEPLYKLDRDSMKFLPRDSLAWITHLPRDSATFLELEKLMHDKDKNLLQEDDTGSFEAMEIRLKTPRKPIQEVHNEDSTMNSDKQENNDNKEIAPTESIEEETEEVVDDLNTTPPPSAINKDRFKVMLTLTPTFSQEESNEANKEKEFTPKSNLITDDLLEELNNMPTNARLATPTIKSRSMSDLATEDEKAQVHRSVSEEKLIEGEQISSLVSVDALHQALQEMETMRKEQEDLERMQEELFSRIRERKESFKKLWGVSPMSVNKTRTVINKDTKSNSTLCEDAKSTNCAETCNDATSNTPEVSRDDSALGNLDYKISTESVGAARYDESMDDTLEETSHSNPQTPSLEGFRRLSGTPDVNINVGTLEEDRVKEDPAMLNTEMKRVRFNSGENKSKYLTPDCEISFKRSQILKESPLCTLSPDDGPSITSQPTSRIPSSLTPAVVKEQAAKYSRRSFTNQSFVSLKSSFAFLQTPGRGGSKIQPIPENIPTVNVTKGVPTPMALKSLSARVKEEYALLYADDDDEDTTEEIDQQDGDHHENQIMKKLNF